MNLELFSLLYSHKSHTNWSCRRRTSRGSVQKKFQKYREEDFCKNFQIERVYTATAYLYCIICGRQELILLLRNQHFMNRARILLKCQEELSLMWGSHKAWLVFMTCVLIKLNTMYPPNELTCVYQGQIMKKLPGFKQLGRSVSFRIIL